MPSSTAGACRLEHAAHVMRYVSGWTTRTIFSQSTVVFKNEMKSSGWSSPTRSSLATSCCSPCGHRV